MAWKFSEARIHLSVRLVLNGVTDCIRTELSPTPQMPRLARRLAYSAADVFFLPSLFKFRFKFISSLEEKIEQLQPLSLSTRNQE
jgi:hypothetical protein